METKPIFPFPVNRTVLKNGLAVHSVPFDSPGIIAYYTFVRTGARNEVEPGKTGFAHFFEHLMFRGTEKISSEKFHETLQSYGADSNAFTAEDETGYHATVSSAALEEVMKLESDRFQNLKYDLTGFQQEAGAVLGEYEKSASHPFTLIEESILETAFTKHPYQHTVIGFKKDILAMPKEYDYSKEFFKRWYRPDNSIILVVGDVDHAKLVKLAEKYYGDWKPGVAKITIPEEPPQKEERRVALSWKGETLPYFTVSYKVPAFTPGIETATLDVLAEALFSATSPLYKKLVLKEKKLEGISGGSGYHRDPHLFRVTASLRSARDLGYVEKEIYRAIDDVRKNGISAQTLADIKSHIRYQFAMALDAPGGVAEHLGTFLQLTTDPNSVNKLFASYQRVSSDHLKGAIARYFGPNNRTVVTLVKGNKTGRISTSKKMVKEPTQDIVRQTQSEEVTEPRAVATASTSSPLVSVRLLLGVGSQDDPVGKEGLCYLTTRMLAEGGTKSLPYAQLLDKLYPIAAESSASTDKELTVFTGVVHEEKVEEFFELLVDQIVDPRFDKEDFERLRKEQLTYLTTSLRGNNDEELGKETLQYQLTRGKDRHPYGHVEAGTVSSVKKLTLEDVKKFYQARYLKGITVRLHGGPSDKLQKRLEERLAKVAAGPSSKVALPAPHRPKDIEILVAEKEAPATAISIGFPIDVTRSDDDFYLLAVANSALGEHREFHGRLMKDMRVKRGLNYGDYSYVEHFAQDSGTRFSQPNIPRRQQYFSIWIRPVAHEKAIFALRQAVRELEIFAEKGLDEEEFERTKKFVLNYSKLWVQTAERRLGFELDGGFYGKRSLVEELNDRIPGMTREKVNAAIRKHLQAKNLSVAIITKNKSGLLEKIATGKPSPIKYDTENTPAAITEEDKVIQTYPLKVNKEASKTIAVSQMFER